MSKKNQQALFCTIVGFLPLMLLHLQPQGTLLEPAALSKSIITYFIAIAYGVLNFAFQYKWETEDFGKRFGTLLFAFAVIGIISLF